MRISVVVTVYNREHCLSAVLRAIRASTYTDYEVIVVDDASCDKSVDVAREYTDKVIRLPSHQGENAARKASFEAATGDIIVSVDSDVIVRQDALEKIAHYFKDNPDVDAITGRTSKEQPYEEFFTQYKNLYMYHTFSQLPDRVTFLYGCIFAVRKELGKEYRALTEGTEDTAFGQRLVTLGRKIAFLKDLETVHLKRYTFFSWVHNDYRVAYYWAHIFLYYKRWKQIGQFRFAHATPGQLGSIAIIPFMFVSGWFALMAPRGSAVFFLFLAMWVVFNRAFICFLARERGVLFSLISVPVVFLENCVKAMGLCAGASMFFLKGFRR